jgi:iron complex transport system substrate-binding protein
MTFCLARRRFAAIATASLVAPRRLLAAPDPSPRPRIAALDWGVAETLVALDSPPVGVAEIPDYDRTVVAPSMPPGVVDVGLRLSPNAELMHELTLDLVLINPAQEYMRGFLAPFGRVEVVPIYTPEGRPYRLSCEAVTRLAQMVGDLAAGHALLRQAEATMDETRRLLRSYDGRPVYIVTFIDSRHVGVAGSRSLFQGVLDQLGLRNAWTGEVGEWGMASVGIERLATDPEARLLYLQPVPPEARRVLTESPLWRLLPFVREGRVGALQPLWQFGALPSAMRIAQQLGRALAPLRHD